MQTTTFWGKVRHGKGRGKNLTFPTANLNLRRKVPEGIYCSLTKIGREKYPSLTFVGNAKTFGDREYKAETFILNFTRSLYGKYISVRLLKKLRDNKKFSSERELIFQMKSDKKEAEEFFKNYPF